MQYRFMKKTGDNLSALGYGCMRLPVKNGKIDRKRAETQIISAVGRGVNYIDTAYPYHQGESEPFLGEILKDKRKDLFLATKLPPLPIQKKEDMERILNNQLSNLQTDYIDYYMLHGIHEESWQKMRDMDVTGFFEKIRKEGKIRHAGFSFHGRLQCFKDIIDFYDWDFCMIQYNYLDEKNQAGKEGLEYASSKGLGIIIMEPLHGGLLGGKMSQKVQEMLDNYPVKYSPAEWSFRWLWDKPEISVVLSGMNEENHIDENIRIACESSINSLNPGDISFIERLRDEFLNGLEIGCTGCGYCLPCNAGVNIPYCFELYNRVKFFGEKKVIDNYFRYYLHLGFGGPANAQRYASKCTKCGLCLKKCPQGIDIPSKLKHVAREYETLTLRLLKPVFEYFFKRALKENK